jgi:hypothetical protein
MRANEMPFLFQPWIDILQQADRHFLTQWYKNERVAPPVWFSLSITRAFLDALSYTIISGLQHLPVTVTLGADLASASAVDLQSHFDSL